MIKKVAAVVVTYNRIGELLHNINALSEQTYRDLDILIIDNASTDGTREAVENLIYNEQVQYFNTGANLGGAGGFNFGMKIAAEKGYERIWIMDDDCIPDKTALEELMIADEGLGGDYGFLSGIAYWRDGSICNMNIQKTGIGEKISDYSSPLVPVIMATFVSILFTNETVRLFGLPIKEFFIWSDDFEYTRRISAEKKCYAVTKSRVLHNMKSNEKVGIENDSPERLDRYRYLYRNEVYVYRREGIKGYAYLFMRATLHLFKVLTSNKQRFHRAGIILKSFCNGWVFNPKIERLDQKKSTNPLRILMLLGEPVSSGGQEKFLLNILSNFDRTKVVFDVFSPFSVENKNTKNKFINLGCRVFTAGLSFTENKNKNFKIATKQFLTTNKYKIVHIHSGSTFALMKGSEIARKSGACRVIVHSHCGGFVDLRYKIIRCLSFVPMLRYPTDYFACSNLAARWKFPAPVIKTQNYTVIKNAVDLTEFHFDETRRNIMRKSLGLQNNLVLGHVGRFAIQKNHSFLLDIFCSVLSKRSDAKLVLVGSGETFEEIMNKSKSLGIFDKIIYLGLRPDIGDIMNAFDVFVLPSFFEGLPIVGVEAQACALPVVTSTGVTKELPIEQLAEYVPLKCDPSVWANKIIAASKILRRDTSKEIINAGYEIKSAAAALQKIYEEMN